MSNKEKAKKYLDNLVKATEYINKTLELSEEKELFILNPRKEHHLNDIPLFSELVDIPYTRVDWDGNEHCQTNHDELYFIYKGVRFFQLADKEEKK